MGDVRSKHVLKSLIPAPGIKLVQSAEVADLTAENLLLNLGWHADALHVFHGIVVAESDCEFLQFLNLHRGLLRALILSACNARNKALPELRVASGILLGNRKRGVLQNVLRVLDTLQFNRNGNLTRARRLHRKFVAPH